MPPLCMERVARVEGIDRRGRGQLDVQFDLDAIGEMPARSVDQHVVAGHRPGAPVGLAKDTQKRARMFALRMC
jgi:hypothetical protein